MQKTSSTTDLTPSPQTPSVAPGSPHQTAQQLVCVDPSPSKRHQNTNLCLCSLISLKELCVILLVACFSNFDTVIDTNGNKSPSLRTRSPSSYLWYFTCLYTQKKGHRKLCKRWKGGRKRWSQIILSSSPAGEWQKYSLGGCISQTGSSGQEKIIQELAKL